MNRRLRGGMLFALGVLAAALAMPTAGLDEENPLTTPTNKPKKPGLEGILQE